jgi:hypothetical protein
MPDILDPLASLDVTSKLFRDWLLCSTACIKRSLSCVEEFVLFVNVASFLANDAFPEWDEDTFDGNIAPDPVS